MSGQFRNGPRDSRVIRGTVIIGVTYQADTAQVEKILLASAEKQEHVLKTPPPSVYLSEFGDSAMNFTLYVYIDDLNNMLQALSELRMRVKSELDRLGIDIPYPQMTLHMTAPDEDIGESGENLLPRKED